MPRCNIIINTFALFKKKKSNTFAMHYPLVIYSNALENPVIVSNVYYNDFEMELADHMEVMGPTKSSLRTWKRFYMRE